MKTFLRGILHPEAYHGRGQPAPFFEGWYVKLVTGDGRRSLALVPGIFRGLERGSAHAFVMIVDPRRPWVDYARFSLDAFAGSDRAFDIRVGPTHFDASGIQVDLEGCRGEVAFGPLTPWPVTLPSPGVMGWYAWVPAMQCYHGIVSLDHPLEGALEVRGEHVDFSGGRGYIEKDWGRCFPKRWIWMQSNHFEETGVSVTASLADVPWLGGAFPGFLVGVWRGGELLRFTTYTGAKVVRVAPLDQGVTLEVEDAHHHLHLTARGGHVVPIHKPDERSMRGVVHEHLDATLEVRLTERSRPERVVFEGVGFQAAYEVHGEVSLLRRRSPFTKAEP